MASISIKVGNRIAHCRRQLAALYSDASPAERATLDALIARLGVVALEAESALNGRTIMQSAPPQSSADAGIF